MRIDLWFFPEMFQYVFFRTAHLKCFFVEAFLSRYAKRQIGKMGEVAVGLGSVAEKERRTKVGRSGS